MNAFYLRTPSLLLGVAVLLVSVAHAQNSPLSAENAAPIATSGRLRVDARNANALFGLEAQRGVRAVELDLTQTQLRQSAAGWRALSRWVARGGVVLLHTDAAQLFGFSTVTPRPRTRERAGQLWGRSRASLPFGAHPLLWGGVSHTLEGRTRGVLGVYLVYYQLQEGDALAVKHRAGVPLLSVTDLSATGREARQPLYAAMLAPYGQGWAIVLPRTIEARADGASFARNLDDFIAATAPDSKAEDAWTSIGAHAVDAAHRQLQGRQSVPSDALARACQQALLPLPEAEWPSSQLPPLPNQDKNTDERATGNEEATGNEDATDNDEAPGSTGERLLMRRDEAKALVAAFESDKAQGPALVRQLSARLAMQRGQAPGSQVANARAADGSLALLLRLDSDARKRLAPTQPADDGAAPDALTSQLQVWNGLMAATAANAFGASAPARAAAWSEAVNWWNLALGQPTEELTANPDLDINEADVMANLDALPPAAKAEKRWRGSVPLALVRGWQHAARREFQVAAREATMVLIWRGPQGEQNALTMYPVDAALPGLPTSVSGNEYPAGNSFRWRLVQRTTELLDGGVRDYMGWGADQVEMRLTPAPWQELSWAMSVVAWLTLVSDSDIKLRGSRIYLWSVPTIFPGAATIFHVDNNKRRAIDRHDSYLKHAPADPNGIEYTFLSVSRLAEREQNITEEIQHRSATPKEKEEALATARNSYYEYLWLSFGDQETFSRTLPGYLTRAHRALLTQSLTQGGTEPPLWLQEGLENIACLSLAGNAKAHGIYPNLPPDLQHEDANGLWSASSKQIRTSQQWQDSVVRATATANSLLSDGAWRQANNLPGGDRDSLRYGPPLTSLPATRQVQFFYKRFGRGAVVETLQRLGAAQTIDQALQATTGLNQQQFLAASNSSQNQAPAAPQRAASAGDAAEEGDGPTTPAMNEARESNAVTDTMTLPNSP